EQNGIDDPRQLHDQEEHKKADNEVVTRVRPLTINYDIFEFVPEIIKGITTDADISGNNDAIGPGRQPSVEIALLIHEKNLQDQRDRHDMRNELLRPAKSCVVVPDQPDELDQRENEDQVRQSDM